jgi:hypothetical protein
VSLIASRTSPVVAVVMVIRASHADSMAVRRR